MLPGAEGPQAEETAGPWVVSTWPSITDAPRWPGVAEYLYQAASSAAVDSDGTWIVPSRFSPRCSRSELTPMAGISTDTGSDRASDGP